jgi:nucleotide-binding universal stress UspA family protein
VRGVIGGRRRVADDGGLAMKILVASSASQESEQPLNAAARFPWPSGSQVHVISVAEVLQPVMVGMLPDTIDTSSVQIPTTAEARQTATSAAQRFRDLGFEAEGIVVEGDPETAIVNHARNWGADVIVVGSHDRSLIERMLVGSVSDRVIKHAPCSVLVVKSDVTD